MLLQYMVKDLVLSSCPTCHAIDQSLNYSTVSMKLLTVTVITVLMLEYIVVHVSIKTFSVRIKLSDVLLLL